MTSSTLFSRWRALVALLILALHVASCGSGSDLLAGVGSGGTGGGTTTDSFSLGAIRGFGSVIVNGVRYDDTTAAITSDDGTTLGRDALRLSMVVEVRGQIDSAGTDGVATQIRVVSEARGVVQSVSPTAGSFVVLGVPVQVSAATVFDGVGSLAGLAAGQSVEVYGFFDRSSRSLSATRVELRTEALSRFKAHGLIGTIDPRTRSFLFGGLVVDYGAAVQVGLGAGPAPGIEVRVSAAAGPSSDGVWRVDRVEAVQAPDYGGASRIKIEGPVNSFGSPSGFYLGGVRADASAAQFQNGNAAGLGEGTRVVMEGRIEEGVFKVSRVEYDRSEVEAPEFQVRGPVDRVTGAGTFVVRNTSVDASAATLDSGTLADLRVGRRVEARGQISGGVLRATRLKFED
ncbi:MAG: hypothetical protein KAY46_06065 [Burkholderiaceae bacterium]|nr:hypothetical protein [Burkholderiaceae bacterium]